MGQILQLDFFADETELLRQELVKTKESGDRVRKGTYSRLNVLQKRCDDLEERLSIVEAFVCQKNSATEASAAEKGETLMGNGIERSKSMYAMKADYVQTKF